MISLLDSGSQVTTISKSFHENHLSRQSILPIQDLLHIEGAGGQEVPYLVYTVVNTHFPVDIMGMPKSVDTLTLVVPDHRTNLEVALFIRTNTLGPLYEKCALSHDKCVGYKTKSSHCSPLVKGLYCRFKSHQQNGRVV